MSTIREKKTVVVGPARDIFTDLIPTSKCFSEYFWRTLYLTRNRLVNRKTAIVVKMTLHVGIKLKKKYSSYVMKFSRKRA